MKMKKRISILAAFMLLMMITFPVTGAFAAENSENRNSQNEQSQKNNEAAAKSADQQEKSNGNVKAASTENDSETEEEIDSETGEQAQNNPEQETVNQSDEYENNANQEGNTKENNGQEESITLLENNGQGEDDTPAEGENESTPAEDGTVPGNDNKSTQIHLHIDQCVNPVETAYVQVDGDWEEMTNPGSSPLFKEFDDGEFIKDDITAFKLIFTTGEELVVPVSEVRVGVEAEGSINFWLENCDLPAEEPTEPENPEDTDEDVNVLSMIKIMIDEIPLQIEKVTLVMMSGKRVDFERVDEMFSLTLTEEIEMELIRGIEITVNGETTLILLSEIESLEIVEKILTLQLNWDMIGELGEEESDETDTEEENETALPGNNSRSGNTTDGTTNEQVWNGEVLPQTGESSRTMFYVLGFLIAAGGIMLRFRNPLKN